ncbi:hypothetical protein QQG55_53375 [Brugia pahangi]
MVPEIRRDKSKRTNATFYWQEDGILVSNYSYYRKLEGCHAMTSLILHTWSRYSKEKFKGQSNSDHIIRCDERDNIADIKFFCMENQAET